MLATSPVDARSTPAPTPAAPGPVHAHPVAAPTTTIPSWVARGRGWLNALITVFLVAVCGFGVIASTETKPAAAFGMCLFGSEMTPIPTAYNAGFDGVLPRVNANSGKLEWGGYSGANKAAYTPEQATVFDAYGTNGVLFTRYTKDQDKETQGDACGDVIGLIDFFVANSVMMINQVLTGTTISMYQISVAPDLMEPFAEVAGQIINGGDGDGGLSKAIYWPFLRPFIMFGALWMAWQGLVKKRTSQSLQAVVWMLAATIVGVMIMSTPAQFFKLADGAVAGVSGAVAGTIANVASSGTADGGICQASGGEATGVRQASCAIYSALLFTPWSVGQFGHAPDVALVFPDGSPAAKDTTVVRDSAFPEPSTRDIRLIHLDAAAQSQNEWVKAQADPKGADAKDWRKRDTESFANLADAIKNEENSATFIETAWRGNDSKSRITMAVLSLIGGIAAAALIILLSFQILMYAVEFVFLMAMSPLFLLVGVHPGFGRGVALRWVELTLNTVVRRIFACLLLAIIMGLYQVIAGMKDMSWLIQVVLMLAVSFGGIAIRKPIMEMFNVVKLGGTDIGLQSGFAAAGAAKAGAAVGKTALMATGAGAALAPGAMGGLQTAKAAGLGKAGTAKAMAQGGVAGAKHLGVSAIKGGPKSLLGSTTGKDGKKQSILESMREKGADTVDRSREEDYKERVGQLNTARATGDARSFERINRRAEKDGFHPGARQVTEQGEARNLNWAEQKELRGRVVTAQRRETKNRRAQMIGSVNPAAPEGRANLRGAAVALGQAVFGAQRVAKQYRPATPLRPTDGAGEFAQEALPLEGGSSQGVLPLTDPRVAPSSSQGVLPLTDPRVAPTPPPPGRPTPAPGPGPGPGQQALPFEAVQQEGLFTIPASSEKVAPRAATPTGAPQVAPVAANPLTAPKAPTSRQRFNTGPSRNSPAAQPGPGAKTTPAVAPKTVPVNRPTKGK